MGWLIAIIIFFLLCFIYEMIVSKDFRTKIRKLSFWIAFITWTILGSSIALLQYVGVYIIYIGVPIGLISSFLWIYLWKHRNTDVDMNVPN